MENIVEKCKAIAVEAHEGQYRKFGADKGKPYIVHPERVASKFDDPYLASIGWLHDVIEDTDVTIDDLKAKGVPPEVIIGVDGMTKRDHENYLESVLRVKANPFARPVKIADIEDNMGSLKEGSLKDKYRLALYVLKNTLKSIPSTED
jgi:(p)ppGpp synthase/HD superfamily hydrolase